jgi:hypothetical protein
MALGTPQAGSVAILLVGLTSTPTTPVGGLISADVPMESPVTTRDYYGQASFVAVGKEVIVIPVVCDYEAADSGQTILFDARISRALVYFRHLPDGTNGETIPTKVNRARVGYPDVNGFQVAEFTLSQFGAPVETAGGLGT